MKVINLEYHPNDSRVKLAADDICQTLTSRMGTGGGNIPIVLVYGFDPGASRDVGELFIKEVSKTLSNGTCPGHHNGVVIINGQDIHREEVL